MPVADASALAAAIDELVACRSLRQRMGGASRAKALLEFDQRRVIEITLGVYASLLGPRSRQLII